MAFLRTGTVLASALILASTAYAARPHHGSSHGKHVKAHKSSFHAPAAMGSERATQIQSALIREHYLSGAPTGVWDDASKSAMTRYQAANGWQTKVTPDSRALIKLGLGPDQTGAAPVEAAASAPAEAAPTAAFASGGSSYTATSGQRTLGSAIAQQQNFFQ